MPFQAFRRYQKSLLAVLAIFAMFAFVVADSLPRLFSNYARPMGGSDDPVVAELYGQPVRRSDLNRLEAERIRANNVLGMLRPYFGPEPPFGPVDDRSLVDAYILEHEAERLGIPRSTEMAKEWIFAQARRRYELLRTLDPGLGPFNEARYDPQSRTELPSPMDELFAQLGLIFQQTYGDQITEQAFLADVANQVRILKALELLAQPMVTPLDTFTAYSDQQIRLEARYVGFPVSEFLDEVPEPKGDDLRAFFEENADRLPDPRTGTVGFRTPRRLKVEYVALGVNAIDVLREQIREEPIAEEVRERGSFDDDVLVAYREEQRQMSSFGDEALPADLFAGDPDAEMTPLPASYVNRYVNREVERIVEERLRDRVEDLFEPFKESLYTFIDELNDELGGDFDTVTTGLEEGVPRDESPGLAEWRELIARKAELDADRRSGDLDDAAYRQKVDALAEDAGDYAEVLRLVETLGPAGRGREGVAAVAIGLTEPLADPELLRSFLGPMGIPDEWQDYLGLAKLDWSKVGIPLLTGLQGLAQSAEGLDRPDLFDIAPSEQFGGVLFGTQAGLFDPQEFTDPLGRRYLAWKSLDLPEASRTFKATPEDLIASSWRRDQARDLAREAAEELAVAVREEAGPDAPSAAALDRLAAEAGRSTQTTGGRIKADPIEAYAPIEADEDVVDALFRLTPTGEEAAVVAPDRDRDTYYTFALTARRDPAAGSGSGVDYARALSGLTGFRTDALGTAMTDRVRGLMDHLRTAAGLASDWTPPAPPRG